MIFIIHESQGHRVDAITLVAWWWSVIENMSQVGVTAGAKQFDTAHTMIVIGALGYVCAIEFTMKTRPATTRVELAIRTEKRVVAADAVIISGLGMITVFPAERGFGTSLAGHPVLFVVQLILPLLRLLDDFLHSVVHCKVQMAHRTICLVEMVDYVKVVITGRTKLP